MGGTQLGGPNFPDVLVFSLSFGECQAGSKIPKSGDGPSSFHVLLARGVLPLLSLSSERRFGKTPRKIDMSSRAKISFNTNRAKMPNIHKPQKCEGEFQKTKKPSDKGRLERLHNSSLPSKPGRIRRMANPTQVKHLPREGT